MGNCLWSGAQRNAGLQRDVCSVASCPCRGHGNVSADACADAGAVTTSGGGTMGDFLSLDCFSFLFVSNFS